MRRKFSFLLIALLAFTSILALTGCDYLDREPLDSIGKEQYFSSANAAASVEFMSVSNSSAVEIVVAALVQIAKAHTNRQSTSRMPKSFFFIVLSSPFLIYIFNLLFL